MQASLDQDTEFIMDKRIQTRVKGFNVKTMKESLVKQTTKTRRLTPYIPT